jgi:LemA protein
MKRVVIGIFGVFMLLIIILGISAIGSYNNLVELDEDISYYYSQIENRLQERHDKIGQILATVIGLQEHAETIYDAITSAREAYANAKNSNDMEALIQADAQEALALTDVLFVVEDNPNITATSGFDALIYEISSMEGALSVARRDYNLSVQAYNAKVRKFPTVIVVNMFDFDKDLPYWRINDGADEVPVIDFGD